MRFLADENVPDSMAKALVAAGQDVILGRDVARSFPDRQLLDVATSQARTVITRDLDFGDLGIRQGLASTGVIILRYHRRDLPSITARLLHVVADCGERLTGSLAVVQVERSRVIALAPGNPEHR